MRDTFRDLTFAAEHDSTVWCWRTISKTWITGSTKCKLGVLGKPFDPVSLSMLLIASSRTGSFDWTTTDPLNSYIDSEGLHIVPTITLNTTDITVNQLLDNYVLNLTTTGTCTSTDVTQCAIRSNSTAGTIINPVRSARLTTQGKFMITYGRVEVVAKMPEGDWLWPAIWYVNYIVESDITT